MPASTGFTPASNPASNARTRWRPIWRGDRLLGREVVEQGGYQKRHGDLGLVEGEGARHDHAILLLQFLTQPPRQHGLPRSNHSREGDQPAALDGGLEVAGHLLVMLGLEKPHIDRRAPRPVMVHHLGEHQPIPPLRPAGKRSRTDAMMMGRDRVSASRPSMNKREHKPTGAAVRRPPKRGPIRVIWKPRYAKARGYGHSRAHTLHLFFFARRAGAICGARAVSPRRHSSS